MNIIHILHEGLPHCGFTEVIPGEWPPGHRWATLKDLEMVTCVDCLLRHQRIEDPERKALAERYHNLKKNLGPLAYSWEQAEVCNAYTAWLDYDESHDFLRGSYLNPLNPSRCHRCKQPTIKSHNFHIDQCLVALVKRMEETDERVAELEERIEKLERVQHSHLEEY